MLYKIPERRINTTDTIEDVIPLYNVEVDLLLPHGYDRATLVPDGQKLEVVRADGRLRIRIPEIRGHVMVSISG